MCCAVQGIVRTVKKLVSRPSAPGQSSYDVPHDLRTVLAEKAMPSMGEILPSKLPNMDDDDDDDNESSRSRNGRRGRRRGRDSFDSDVDNDDRSDDDRSDDTEAAIVKSVDDSAVRVRRGARVTQNRTERP